MTDEPRNGVRDVSPLTRIYIVGHSNSGKTTLIERLVPLLRERGLRVATMKHAHHGFQQDVEGKDSRRHAQAGADPVVVIGPRHSMCVMRSDGGQSPDDWAPWLAQHADILLIEGFKALAAEPDAQVVLGAGAQDRIVIDGQRCCLGVLPEALADDEWRTVVGFCMARAGRAAEVSG